MANSNNYSQFELFPQTPTQDIPVAKPIVSFSFRGVNLSVENLIFVFICLILSGVMLYSVGVESGRKYAHNMDFPQVEKNSVQNQENDVLLQSAKSGVEGREAPVSRISESVETQEAVTEEVLDIPLPVENEIVEDDAFTIQVASFKRMENAEKEATMIKSSFGHESFVLSKGSYTIVCVGRFPAKNEARQFSRKLKKKYNDCLVRRL